MSYEHKQRGSLHYLLEGVAAILIVWAWFASHQPVLAAILGVSGGLIIFFALSFRSMTVSDEGDHLAIRYGPLPIFRKSIAYRDIDSVEAGTSLFRRP